MVAICNNETKLPDSWLYIMKCASTPELMQMLLVDITMKYLDVLSYQELRSVLSGKYINCQTEILMQ